MGKADLIIPIIFALCGFGILVLGFSVINANAALLPDTWRVGSAVFMLATCIGTIIFCGWWAFQILKGD